MHSVGVCVSCVWQSLSDITELLSAGHQSGSQWTHSYQAASAQLATRKPRLHAIGWPSKRQPMNSLVSSCLGSTHTSKVIKLMYKNKIEKINTPPPKYSSSMVYIYIYIYISAWIKRSIVVNTTNIAINTNT